jgi:Xaa-Pro aminopeptidase
MTRCLACGDIVQEQEQEQGWNSKKMNNDGIYTLLQNIVETLLNLAKPGTKVADLDKKARELLGEYAPYFTHSLGHGVGIDIHEKPFLSIKSDEILEA